MTKVKGEVAHVMRLPDTPKGDPQVQLHMTSLNVYQTALGAPCASTMAGWTEDTEFWVELKLDNSGMIVAARRTSE